MTIFFYQCFSSLQLCKSSLRYWIFRRESEGECGSDAVTVWGGPYLWRPCTQEKQLVMDGWIFVEGKYVFLRVSNTLSLFPTPM